MGNAVGNLVAWAQTVWALDNSVVLLVSNFGRDDLSSRWAVSCSSSKYLFKVFISVDIHSLLPYAALTIRRNAHLL